MRAYAAPDTRCPFETHVVLGVGSYIDTHLAVGAAIAARDAHIIFHSDTEAPELLHESHDGRKRAEEATPNPASKNRVEADAKHSGHYCDYEETIEALYLERDSRESWIHRDNLTAGGSLPESPVDYHDCSR